MPCCFLYRCYRCLSYFFWLNDVCTLFFFRCIFYSRNKMNSFLYHPENEIKKDMNRIIICILHFITYIYYMHTYNGYIMVNMCYLILSPYIHVCTFESAVNHRLDRRHVHVRRYTTRYLFNPISLEQLHT